MGRSDQLVTILDDGVHRVMEFSVHRVHHCIVVNFCVVRNDFEVEQQNADVVTLLRMLNSTTPVANKLDKN